jgi:D-2-hydroxyacid dehydrogenase (NADP+)
MPNVLVLLALPEKFREYYDTELRRDFPSVNFIPVDHVSKTEPHLATADALVTFGPHLLDRAEHVFRSMKNLKWVQAMGTGVDNIAEISTLRKEVRLTNIHGIHGVPMSEAAIGSMLALTRDIPRVVRNQDAGRWERFPPALLNKRTAGILGIGAIAEVLAPRLKMLGMKVVGISSSPRNLPGYDEMRSRDNLAEAVRDLDHLIILTPHTAQTHNIINAAILAAMKPGSYIVNLARGGVVDEDALIAALESGHIAGAALDVFATEPLPAGHPLWSLKNVIITPHLGGFSHDSSRDVMPALKHNMECFLAGDYDRMVNRVQR